MTPQDMHELAQVDRIARAQDHQTPSDRVWPWADACAVVGLAVVALGAGL